jgi:hypothetical protein
MQGALAASVILGLVPGIVFARQMVEGRLVSSSGLESICATLCLPGLLLTPLPHMGPIAFVMVIPMNMLSYFGLTRAMIWLIRLFAQNR